MPGNVYDLFSTSLCPHVLGMSYKEHTGGTLYLIWKFNSFILVMITDLFAFLFFYTFIFFLKCFFCFLSPPHGLSFLVKNPSPVPFFLNFTSLRSFFISIFMHILEILSCIFNLNSNIDVFNEFLINTRSLQCFDFTAILTYMPFLSSSNYVWV